VRGTTRSEAGRIINRRFAPRFFFSSFCASLLSKLPSFAPRFLRLIFTLTRARTTNTAWCSNFLAGSGWIRRQTTPFQLVLLLEPNHVHGIHVGGPLPSGSNARNRLDNNYRRREEQENPSLGEVARSIPVRWPIYRGSDWRKFGICYR